MATSQGKSFVECLGDGATTTFSVPFPYLSPEHVEVLVDDVAVAYNFLTTNSLEVTPAPADQSTVRIRRQTPDDPLVDFSQGNQFSRTKLLTAYQQILYVAQEAFDEGTTITVDVSASFAEIVNQITTSTSDLQAQIDAYTAQFNTDIQAADADFASQIAALQDFPSDLQQLLDDLDAAYTALQADVDQLELDVAAAEGDLATLLAFELPTPEVGGGGGNSISGLDYNEPTTFDELVLLDKPHTFIGLGEAGFPFTNLGTGLATVTGGQVNTFQSAGLLNLPGAALEFDGGNSGVYFGTLQADDPLYSPGTSFTAFLWARLDDLSEPTEVRNTLISTIQGGGWGLEVTDDDSDDVLDTLSFIARTQAGAYERCEVSLADAGITAGVPFGVVLRYNNPTMEIFVNGSLAATFQATPDQGYIHPATVQGFFLGGDLSSAPTSVDSDTGIDGCIDTFIFYCHSISNDRIARIHQAAVDGSVPLPAEELLCAGVDGPTHNSPADAAVDVSLNAPLVLDITVDAPGTHTATRWQVATDAGFGNIVYDVTSDTDLTSHTTGVLQDNTVHYWRAQVFVTIEATPTTPTSFTTIEVFGISSLGGNSTLSTPYTYSGDGITLGSGPQGNSATSPDGTKLAVIVSGATSSWIHVFDLTTPTLTLLDKYQFDGTGNEGWPGSGAGNTGSFWRYTSIRIGWMSNTRLLAMYAQTGSMRWASADFTANTIVPINSGIQTITGLTESASTIAVFQDGTAAYAVPSGSSGLTIIYFTAAGNYSGNQQHLAAGLGAQPNTSFTVLPGTDIAIAGHNRRFTAYEWNGSSFDIPFNNATEFGTSTGYSGTTYSRQAFAVENADGTYALLCNDANGGGRINAVQIDPTLFPATTAFVPDVQSHGGGLGAVNFGGDTLGNTLVMSTNGATLTRNEYDSGTKTLTAAESTSAVTGNNAADFMELHFNVDFTQMFYFDETAIRAVTLT